MRVLVDTPVWSLALRRTRGDLGAREKHLVLALQDLIHSRSVVLVGPVRQEVLSGIADELSFERVRDQLSEFPNEPLDVTDDEEAARCFNRFAARGIASSATDCLLCAVALNRHIPIFTRDRDFERYRKAVPLGIFDPSGGEPG